jgi:hypothetical protein
VKKKYTINDIKIRRITNRAHIDMKVDFNRMETKAEKTQYLLDSRVMEDMIPYMPMRDGLFIATTRAMSQAIAGSGRVVAGAPPFGKFLYEGRIMIDPLTGSPWARRGAKKILTRRHLKYSKGAHPQAQRRWFDVAKKKHLEEWIELVNRQLE